MTRGLSEPRKRHAKEGARARRAHKGRTPHPDAERVVRAAERAERQAGHKEAKAQLDEREEET